MADRYDASEVKRRLAFLDLIAHEGVAVRRSGPHFIARCPFHEERSGSFTIHGPRHDHGHCYGCGWNGDVFDFWRERHGGTFGEAVAALASLASVSPGVFEVKRKQASQVTRMARREAIEKPLLPRLRALTDEEIDQLARLRGLDRDAVATASALKRVAGCVWPQFLDRQGCWRVAGDATACWVVTDSARNVAQFRRLDGGTFRIRRGRTSNTEHRTSNIEEEEIKAWTKGSPTWPIGAGEIGSRVAVLMVEGGADMLAANHFLGRFGRLEQVAVCAMLGASMRIADEALKGFARKRVRIVMDEDEPKDERGIRPGCEAAARWTAQLIEAGAAVETFSLAGLLQRDGSKVKDLNDLALVDEAAWLDPELRAAFLDFDF